ncbi:hypothetical protein [Chelatococcus composti]|uniref:Uncharacterized protein n=1 Tax=Chelatococcus composti TaxID=1743235 RepID=A0A841KAZ0_9HYPH|nr:hypothetical protein [Chelatococcus composti]MBB6169455.1 hypothetical protein [Chelatococcus composti]MBS7737020.1 hypothetical protein [Chelatococcus composti]GGG47878.1 hypothetical protein GCM10008026_31410 [Chelatococcus composti]
MPTITKTVEVDVDITPQDVAHLSCDDNIDRAAFEIRHNNLREAAIHIARGVPALRDLPDLVDRVLGRA